MYLQTLLIVICLLVILIFVFYHLRYRNRQKEDFSDDVLNIESDEKTNYKEYEETLNSLFNTYLFRKAEPSEILDFMKAMSDSADTETAEKKIKKSDEYKLYKRMSKEVDTGEFAPVTPVPTEQTETKFSSSPSLAKILESSLDDMKIDDRKKWNAQIIRVFSLLLHRYPTTEELKYYSIRLHTDDKFTLSKLYKLIKSSAEHYQIKNNSQNIDTDHPGDQQVNFEVNQIYEDVTSDLDPPAMDMTPELFNFLKMKYRQYELQEDRLAKLINKIYQIDLDTNILNAEKVLKKQNIVHSEDYSDEYFKMNPSLGHFKETTYPFFKTNLLIN